MTEPGARDRHEAARARLEAELQAIADTVSDAGEDEDALRLASWVTERLRTAMLAAADARGLIAIRLREALRMSFTDLGKIMGVTRARAAEIIDTARKKAAEPSRPGIALAVITGPGGVLVSKRTDRTPPWSFIGGEVEPGESVMEAAVREVREETGAVVTAAEVIGARDHPVTGRHVSYVACRLADPDAEVGVMDAGELAEVRWVDLGDARLLMPTIWAPVDVYLTRTLGE